MATKRTMKTVEDVFATKVAQYPENFYSCRDTGHRWHPTTAMREKNGIIRRVLTCSACGTDRKQTLDKSGYVVDASYEYSAGYVLPGTGRLSSAHRAILRLASVLRTID